MVPAIGDIIGNRYTLIAQYRSEPGLSAWLANDHTLMRDCQLFIVSDSQKLPQVNALASSLALSHDPHFTRVLRFQREEGASVIVTETDPGISLSEFIQQGKQRNRDASQPIIAVETMRTICGKTIEAVNALRQHSLSNHALSTRTVRLTKTAISIADTAVSPMLTTPLKPNSPVMNDEELAIKQIGSLLFEMITGLEYDPHKDGAAYATELRRRNTNIPEEFESICVRTLGLPVQTTMESERPIPILTLLELEMLLGSTWTEPKDLPHKDYAIPSTPGAASIETVTFAAVDLHDVVEIPAALFTKNTVQDGGAGAAAKRPGWDRNDLLFNGPESVEQITPDSDEDFFSMFSADGRPHQSGRSASANRRAGGGRNGQAGVTANSAAGQSRASSSQPFVATSAKVVPLSSGASRSQSSLAPADGVQPAAQAQQGATPAQPAKGASASAHAPTSAAAVSARAGRSAQSSAQPGANSQARPAKKASKTTANTASQNGKKARKHEDGISNKAILWTVIGVLAVLLVWSMVQLNVGSLFTGDSDTSAWTIDANTTPLPNGQKNPSADESTKKSTSSSSSSSKSSSSSASSKKSTSNSSTDANTKVASAVPAPAAPANTTPYSISSIRFIRSSASVSGYGLYIHLSQPEQVSQVKITLRSGGGQASLYANSTPQNPNNGAALAQFSFADNGQPTTIDLSSPTQTQDLMIWVTTRVPNGFHYRTVQVF